MKLTPQAQEVMDLIDAEDSLEDYEDFIDSLTIFEDFCYELIHGGRLANKLPLVFDEESVAELAAAAEIVAKYEHIYEQIAPEV